VPGPVVAAPGLVQPRSAADDAALRPLRVEARSARRQVPARHSVRAASRSAPRVCREAAHRAPMAVARSGERRKDQPEFVAQPELVARPMVARPVMVVLSRQAAEAQPVARCAAEVGQEVRHSAEARPLAEPVAVRPKGLDAGWRRCRPRRGCCRRRGWRSWTRRCRCRWWWRRPRRGRRRRGGRRRGTRRWCRSRRCGVRLWWRCAARRLLGPSVRTEFFPGLGHHKRRGLRVRCRRDPLHRRERGGRKQQKPDVGSHGLYLRKFRRKDSADQRIDVRPDCGGPQSRIRIYLQIHRLPMRDCSLRIQTMGFNGSSHGAARYIGSVGKQVRVGGRLVGVSIGRWRRCGRSAALGSAAHQASCRAILPAAAARPGRASEAAPPVSDCRADSPAEAARADPV